MDGIATFGALALMFSAMIGAVFVLGTIIGISCYRLGFRWFSVLLAAVIVGYPVMWGISYLLEPLLPTPL